MTTSNQAPAEQVKSKITVDEITESFKKGLKQAQIRQTVTTMYPSARIADDMRDSLYSEEQLGVTKSEYSQERVTWIPVKKGMTVKSVQADLDKVPNACIYRILSLSPILNPGQQAVLNNGLTGEAFTSFVEKFELNKEEWDEECSEILLANIADRQTVKYGENNTEDKDADAPVLYNGKKQYRELCFSLTPRNDFDFRGEDKQAVPNINLVGEGVTANEKVNA